ncbi:Arm DNA-binding domain-containing protein [Pseudomonas sp. TH31]|uniref:Arm DNA-binding domain-containing protein n=1 Tax=Pseudomonas sp. TH31 TaxID=2796396 RepID=UPI00313F05BC
MHQPQQAGAERPDGLALFVSTEGAKWWYFRFSWGDKQPRISLETFPEISLRDDRALHDVARALVARALIRVSIGGSRVMPGA